MITATEREAIYQSQQKDRWEFKKDASGYFWIRIASNNEVVGVSHRAFSKLDDCEANARMVGYMNDFRAPRTATWELYSDKKNDYRWRLLDTKGVVLNRCHEGYKSKDSAEKNAIRHGYSLVSNVDASTATMQECNYCEVSENPDCCNLPIWPRLLILLGFITLALYALQNAAMKGATLPVPDEVLLPAVTQHFTDVPNDHSLASCVSTLVESNVISGYKELDGQERGTFDLQRPVSKQELAKMALAATDSGIFGCAPTNSEPVGTDWARPYLHCANAKDWREYKNKQADYTVSATKAQVARTFLDAFSYTEAQAANVGLLAPLGKFKPNELSTREQTSALLCRFLAQ